MYANQQNRFMIVEICLADFNSQHVHFVVPLPVATSVVALVLMLNRLDDDLHASTPPRIHVVHGRRVCVHAGWPAICGCGRSCPVLPSNLTIVPAPEAEMVLLQLPSDILFIRALRLDPIPVA